MYGMICDCIGGGVRNVSFSPALLGIRSECSLPSNVILEIRIDKFIEDSCRNEDVGIAWCA